MKGGPRISVEQLLLGVAGSGELVTVAYNGGTRPGQPRPVVPLSLSADELVAVEPGSEVHKTYKLNLIAWVELSSGERATNPAVLAPVRIVADVPDLETLAAYVEHFRAELTAAGWYLHEEAESFGIGTRFKNGKPKKTPSIWLRYFDPAMETVFDLESEELRTIRKELTGRERPWRVDSWSLTTGKTFHQLRAAFALFIDEARSSDPATAKGCFSGH